MVKMDNQTNTPANNKPNVIDNEIRVVLLDHWNSDRDVAESAWVSTQGPNTYRPDEDVKRVLETSIVPLHHDTPKECVWFKFYLHVPIYVERQLDKYRMSRQVQNMTVDSDDGSFGRLGISQNELSLRYKTMPNTYIPLPTDAVDIINRIHDHEDFEYQHETKYSPDVVELYDRVNQYASLMYDNLVKFLQFGKEHNIITASELRRVREVYRGILGTAFFTDMQIILNLNSLEHLFNQRLSDHAQPETRLAVHQMLECLVNNKILPITINKMIEVNKWVV
jgi:thymidylate synthase ThyX